jgi:hypothetical protein
LPGFCLSNFSESSTIKNQEQYSCPLTGGSAQEMGLSWVLSQFLPLGHALGWLDALRITSNHDFWVCLRQWFDLGSSMMVGEEGHTHKVAWYLFQTAAHNLTWKCVSFILFIGRAQGSRLLMVHLPVLYL